MKNIVFIGMMGTFKTGVAREVAARMNRTIIDTDAVFISRYGAIDKYFAEFGEAAFREKEHEIVVEAAARDGAVISCGGGVVLSPNNMTALKANGVTVQLTASIDAIVRRVGKAETRPLLKDDVEKNVREIMLARRPLYKQYADVTVDNTSMTVVECAQTVIAKIMPYLRTTSFS